MFDDNNEYNDQSDEEPSVLLEKSALEFSKLPSFTDAENEIKNSLNCLEGVSFTNPIKCIDAEWPPFIFDISSINFVE